MCVCCSCVQMEDGDKVNVIHNCDHHLCYPLLDLSSSGLLGLKFINQWEESIILIERIVTCTCIVNILKQCNAMTS